MELLHERFTSDSNSTLSLLFEQFERTLVERDAAVAGPRLKFECFLCEDEYRDVKVKGETRIPAGRREIKLRTEGGMHEAYKKRFGDSHKGMLWLQDVPNFEFAYLHIGNDEGDTEGCPLTGLTARINVTGGGKVEQSELAYLRLARKVYEAIERGERVFITTVDRDR